MGDTVIVSYKGMICKMFRSYLHDNGGPLVMITSPHDIEKAYQLGFDCIGHPTEIAKSISEEEYRILCMTGKLD